MSSKCHQPETLSPCRTGGMDQPAAPAPEAASSHHSMPGCGDDLERTSGLAEGQFHDWPPATGLPPAPNEFEFVDTRIFVEDLEDVLRRRRDAPESAGDGIPTLRPAKIAADAARNGRPASRSKSAADNGTSVHSTDRGAFKAPAKECRVTGDLENLDAANWIRVDLEAAFCDQVVRGRRLSVPIPVAADRFLTARAGISAGSNL
jgi:hypothetical protein